MLFGLELLFIGWTIHTVAKENSPKRKKDDDDSEEFFRITSGYDPYRNVLWTLEQRINISEEE